MTTGRHTRVAARPRVAASPPPNRRSPVVRRCSTAPSAVGTNDAASRVTVARPQPSHLYLGTERTRSLSTSRLWGSDER